MVDTSKRSGATLAARYWGNENVAQRLMSEAGAAEGDYETVADGPLETTLIVARSNDGLYALERLLERGVVVRVPDLMRKTTNRKLPAVKVQRKDLTR